MNRQTLCESFSVALCFAVLVMLAGCGNKAQEARETRGGGDPIRTSFGLRMRRPACRNWGSGSLLRRRKRLRS